MQTGTRYDRTSWSCLVHAYGYDLLSDRLAVQCKSVWLREVACSNATELLCGAQISPNGGNTTTMKNHLMGIHRISISTGKRKLESSQSTIKFLPWNRMTLPRNCCPRRSGAFASVDGTSLNAISSSVANKCLAKQHGHTLPTSHETIRTLWVLPNCSWRVQKAVFKAKFRRSPVFNNHRRLKCLLDVEHR